MSAKYKISLPDGNEYLVNDLPEIQRLYCEGRINADILVQPSGDYQWYPLNELFDLSGWNNTAPKNPGSLSVQSDSIDAATAYYGRGPSTVAGLERPSIRGMRAAGILMLINALITITSFAVSHSSSTFGASAPVVATMDVIVGIAVITGRWRPFAIARLGLGLLFIASRFAIRGEFTTQATLGALFQVVFLSGFAVLLANETISIVRTVMGVAMVGLAWVGISIVSIVFSYPAMKRNAESAQFLKQVKPFVAPERQFKDIEAGVMVDLPEGWLRLATDNPIVKAPTARMIAVEPQDGSYALLIMEYLPNSRIKTVDDYIASMERNLTEKLTEFKEISRAHTVFGNEGSVRIEVSWIHDKTKLHGWRSVCKRGDVYYVLSGWLIEGRQDEAFPKYKELESRFTLTTFSSDETK